MQYSSWLNSPKLKFRRSLAEIKVLRGGNMNYLFRQEHPEIPPNMLAEQGDRSPDRGTSNLRKRAKGYFSSLLTSISVPSCYGHHLASVN